MRLVIRLLSFALLLVALSFSTAVGAPMRPADAEDYNSGVLAICEDGPVLKHIWKLKDGSTWAEIHMPNQPAKLTLKFKEAPGQGGRPYEIYDGDERISGETLSERYQSPCDLYPKPKQRT